MVLDREHYRTRFVAAAVRAGQLLLGRGDTDQAEAVARRALAVDRGPRTAYAVLVAAALAKGDRSAAHRLLDRCLAALAELGVEPSEPTLQLRRRLRARVRRRTDPRRFWVLDISLWRDIQNPEPEGAAQRRAGPVACRWPPVLPAARHYRLRPAAAARSRRVRLVVPSGCSAGAKIEPPSGS